MIYMVFHLISSYVSLVNIVETLWYAARYHILFLMALLEFICQVTVYISSYWDYHTIFLFSTYAFIKCKNNYQAAKLTWRICHNQKPIVRLTSCTNCALANLLIFSCFNESLLPIFNWLYVTFILLWWKFL